jgi:membrane-associated phospholipid phosphatase
MKSLLRKNLFFFIPYIIVLAISSSILLLYNKASIHLFINKFHTPFLDYFFKYFTHLADGIFVFIIGVLIFLNNKKRSLYILLSFGLSSAIAQILKKVFYFEHLRPSIFFSDLSNLYIVPGIEIHGYFSFPSGHATSAFCIATCLVISGSNRAAQICLFLYALVAAYSRMYLSQHFLVDVVIGSIIGVICATIIYPLFYYWNFLNKNSFLNKILNK